ncbi:amidohydrolase [Glaciecola sp. SC05]|uniref:amidohydrolase family protein n=1 Tax=Glaciecola sp. SC05 TaxID=1987355 RepID=UPI0035293F30
MITKVIDPHVHLFDLQAGEYGWLNTLSPVQQAKIARSFIPTDMTLNGDACLVGLVHIEAGFDNHQPWREIQNVEALITQYNQSMKLSAHEASQSDTYTPLQCRSAGYANLIWEPQHFADAVNKQSEFRSCKGIRHILDDDAHSVLTSEHAVANLQYLERNSLLFELQAALCDESTADLLVEVLKKVPNLAVVLNHAGFAPLSEIYEDASSLPSLKLAIWQNNMSRLAQMPKVSVKCSAWEMMQPDYVKAEFQFRLKACIKYIAKCFTDERMMFASNFPLVLFAQGYADYWTHMIELGRDCELDINKVCFENAQRIYQFED